MRAQLEKWGLCPGLVIVASENNEITLNTKKITVFLIDHLMSVFSTYKKKLIIPLTALLRELL